MFSVSINKQIYFEFGWQKKGYDLRTRFKAMCIICLFQLRLSFVLITNEDY
jgi:hypothetical protein